MYFEDTMISDTPSFILEYGVAMEAAADDAWSSGGVTQ